MKVKTLINLHKGSTAPFVAALMWGYQNFSLAAWVYLALHGTYGILWLLKDQLYPDKQWEAEISPAIVELEWGSRRLYPCPLRFCSPVII